MTSHTVSSLTLRVNNSGIRVSRVASGLPKACCPFVPFISAEHSRSSYTALYLLCIVGTFLVLYPKMHRLFRIMVSLKK